MERKRRLQKLSFKMEKKRRLSYSESVSTTQIDQLPDDLLVLILSKLTLKEAARTSAVSHKWENLWLYYAGSLNFDNVDAKFDTHLLSIEGFKKKLSIERPRFISWVDHVLNSLRGSTLDGFRVRFDLDASYGDDIERWIKFAGERKVSRLELDFSEFHGFNINDVYQFPSELLSSLGSLTCLRLVSVDLSDVALAHIISNCQSLEHLSIEGADSLTYLNATTALKLKRLEIEYCHNLEYVDISNTNINSLKFNGEWEPHSALKNLGSLREVSLSGDWCFGVIKTRFRTLPISQLQRLELDIGNLNHIQFAEVFPTLCNLKHLEVTVMARHNQNIFCLSSLICACPLLSSFTLKVHYLEPSPYELWRELPNCEWRKSEKRVHECLKVVELIGWLGYESDMDLICYLIDKSVVLDKVIIDPKLPFVGIRSASNELREKIAMDRAQLMQKNLPPGIEEMGWDIVRKRAEKPGERSRLWLPHDIFHVLTMNTGTTAVEGISLSPSSCLTTFEFDTRSFKKMSGLRLLVLNDKPVPSKLGWLSEVSKYIRSMLRSSIELECLTNLRWLTWEGFILDSLPDFLGTSKLVGLEIPCSRIVQLWEEGDVPNGRKVVAPREGGVGLVEGCRGGKDNVIVSHLQFASDTILFLEEGVHNFKNVMTIIQDF